MPCRKAAPWLGVPLRTLYFWLGTGDVRAKKIGSPAIRGPRRVLLVRLADVRRMMKRRRVCG